MKTRREFIKLAGLGTAASVLPWNNLISNAYAQSVPIGPLDPASLPKYVTPLVIPPAMPRTAKLPVRMDKNIDYYEIAVRQFRQQILPAGFPGTTVWGYGSVNHPGTFNYPSFTIEAKHGAPVRVKWLNQLVDASGNYLPHLLTVDPTLHWANPAGPRDTRPTFKKKSAVKPYTGPVPIVPHVHGAHVQEESDGYPEAWWLPDARNIPSGYYSSGTWYDPFKAKSEKLLGQKWDAGSAVFQYPNDQRATTLWYHDHSLGMTRLNVYAGPAGFFIVRGGAADLPSGILPGPAPALGDPAGTRYYEIPLAIQDRAFNEDGSLFYAPNRAFFDEFAGPYIPKSDISPFWNPEFFGDTMVVNGNTWPNLNVEPRRYRFRLLNGCQGRFLVLKLVLDPMIARPAASILPVTQIGTEGGFLPAPISREQVLMSPAERADVIVDFTNVPVGTEIYLINEGPDEPFAGGAPFEEFDPANPLTTGQVMKFTVVPLNGIDTSLPVDQLTLPSLTPLGAAVRTRKLALMEESSDVLKDVGPRAATLGTVDDMGNPTMQMWSSPITENPGVGDTEIWELYNFTMDAHPIHLHQVMFQVMNRQPLMSDAENMAMMPAMLAGPAMPPEPWETGFKETVIAYPGQVTRLKAKFDIPGQFVWHCHIVEHEDNEMMRPYRVG